MILSTAELNDCLIFDLGHKGIVDYLIQKGANVNHVSNDGNTALIWGSVNGELGSLGYA